MSELVSVVIPVYNAERFVGATIESVLAQDWPSIEVIAVDDGSTDGSVAAIQRFAPRGVRLVTKSNSGGPAARNTGFGVARGAFVQFLDHDDLLAPDKISAQMSMGPSTATPVAGLWSRFRTNADGAYGGWQPPADIRHDWSPLDWLIASPLVPTCAWLVPRQLVEKTGGWNEHLASNPDDDGEFFMRVLAQADRVRFCERARSYFRTEAATSAGHNRSVAALQSIFEICKSFEAIVLARTNSDEAKRACVARYLAFMYMAYPQCPGLIADAEQRVLALGGDPSRVPNTPSYERLSAVTGWRTAKRLQQMWQAARRALSDSTASRH